MSSRIDEFRGRTVKEAMLTQASNNSQSIENLYKMVLGLASQVHKLSERVDSVSATSRVSNWRSTAIAKLLDKHHTLKEEEVVHKAHELQIEDFDLSSEEFDKKNNLIKANDEEALDQYYAIANLKLFKENKELFYQEIVRTRVQVGTKTLFPEVHQTLRGMKVGESRRFKINILDQADEAQITLIGLRKSASTN